MGWAQLSRAGTQLEAGTPKRLVPVSLGLRLGSNGAPGPQEWWEELFTSFSKAKAELLCDPCKKCLHVLSGTYMKKMMCEERVLS